MPKRALPKTLPKTVLPKTLPKTALPAVRPEIVRFREPGRRGPRPVAPLRPAAARGERRTAAELLPPVYDELRRLARARLRRMGPAAALTPTELVHETYLRLTRGRADRFDGRRHFFFAAARAMRDIAVEAARRRASLKRGGDMVQIPLEGVELAAVAPRARLLDLDRALGKLGRVSPEGARVVRLSFFGGLTHPEIARALGVSRATVERRWTRARAWLRRELSRGEVRAA